MSDYTEVCRCADFRLLSVWMAYINRHINLTRMTNHELEKYVDSGMMAGLTEGDN